MRIMSGANAERTKTPAKTWTSPITMKENSFGVKSARIGSIDGGRPVQMRRNTPMKPIVFRGASRKVGSEPSGERFALRTGTIQNRIGQMSKMIEQPRTIHTLCANGPLPSTNIPAATRHMPIAPITNRYNPHGTCLGTRVGTLFKA